MQKHMATSAACAEALVAYLDAVLAENWAVAEVEAEKVSRLEDEADELKRMIRLNLPRSIFMPMSRTDLLELLQTQDTIANVAKDIVGIILGRRMAFPPSMHDGLREFLKVGIQATDLAKNVLSELNDLVETGFSGSEMAFIEGLVRELHRVEHQSDLQQVTLRRMLFEMEDDLNPIDVMFYYRVIDDIGDLADNAQAVGNRMLYLIAR